LRWISRRQAGPSRGVFWAGEVRRQGRASQGGRSHPIPVARARVAIGWWRMSDGGRDVAAHRGDVCMIARRSPSQRYCGQPVGWYIMAITAADEHVRVDCSIVVHGRALPLEGQVWSRAPSPHTAGECRAMPGAGDNSDGKNAVARISSIHRRCRCRVHTPVPRYVR
jgi:hypothetical protein